MCMIDDRLIPDRDSVTKTASCQTSSGGPEGSGALHAQFPDEVPGVKARAWPRKRI